NLLFFFFSSRRRHTRFSRDWSSDVCSSDLADTNIQEINDDVKKVVNNVLHSEGYNSFNIIVSQSEYVQIIETEEKAQNEEAYMAEWNSSGVLPIINKELNKEEKFYVDSINTGILDGAMKWKIKLSLE